MWPLPSGANCLPDRLLSFSTSQPLPLPGYGFNAGVYGDVQRVKILYNKKDSALIQMSDGNQAQLGEPMCEVLSLTDL